MVQGGKIKLSFWQLLSFGALTTPLSMGVLALVLYIPTFYAVDIGLGLAAVGTVFVFGRIFDVISDPLIGYFSDRTRSKFGARRPWMVLGLPFFCIAAWLLLSPPEGVGLTYLICVSAAYFLFFTIVDIPYSSIGLEISPDVNERSMLAGSKTVFQVIGMLVVASLPFVLSLPIPQSLGLIAQLIIALSILAVAVFLLFVPTANRDVTAPSLSLIESYKLILKHRTYRYLIGSFFIVQSANSLTAGLMVLFVIHILKTPDLVGAYIGFLLLTTALFLPLWIYLSRKYSKQTSWIISILICIAGLGASAFLGAGDILPLFIVCAIVGAATGCDSIMPTSILADIVSETERDGQNRLAAAYLAVKNATSKLTFVIPMGIAFPTLEFMGFDGKADNGPNELFVLVIFFAILPMILRFLAVLVIRRSPISIAEQNLANG